MILFIGLQQIRLSFNLSQVETSITLPSNTSVEMPRVESVRPSGVIIENWVSDDDEDIFQSNDVQTTIKPSFKKINYNHLIKDCDFHEKRMSKKICLNDKGKVLTRSGRIPVSTAKQYVNTATPKNRVNVSKSKINTFLKLHSSIRRPFYKSTVLNTRVSKDKVNTVRVNDVNTAGQTTISTVKGNGVTAVKALAGCVWRLK
ncbi:hypothetical protein Tco_0963073 [Tanacetum coccineum]